ncbi:putative glycosyltransferase [Geobacter sp. OR-1]|uniref:glycosyltransferase family 2 protein n=1 Tax=Geobacter sp. OR-1 TaxID=1266765 RepID=UPI000542CECD|nr:glycosyltransferase [Geobacter sp. OR-1]GAM11025.1 putative glycosyltransferase [Geobacter sp. OR-1]
MIKQLFKDIKISVLMPVYNGAQYLKCAIESILNQTLTDLEFIIINDGSTDDSVNIIKSYTDPRIRLVHNETNLGLIASLNKGIEQAKGEYIARMDCDDISLPERLSKQAAFLDRHPEVGICGTWFRSIGDESGLVCRFPTDPDLFRSELLFDSVIGHPSVMFRRKLFQDGNLYYDPAFRHAEDFELWSRAVDHCEVCSLPEMLVLYRYHSSQVSQQRADEQKATAGKVRLAQIRRLGIEPSEDELLLHQSFGSLTHQDNPSFFVGAGAWLNKLKKANDSQKIYPEPQFSYVLCERWFRLCLRSIIQGQWTWRIFSPPKAVVNAWTGLSYTFKFTYQHLFDYVSKMVYQCKRSHY